MNPRLASFALLGLALASRSSAQDNTVQFSNFESGLPLDWSATEMCRLAQNGECGAVSQMVWFNSPAPACNYAGPGLHGGLLLLPVMSQVTGQYPWQISFDYILDIDPTGDSVGIAVRNSAGILLLLAQTSLFVNDGALHSIALSFDGPWGPMPGQVGIFLTSDGNGDLGRGLAVDNVRVSNALPGMVYCDGNSPTPSCPCGNISGVWRGCGSSMGPGASLRGFGNPSVSADSFELGVVDGRSGSPTLYFEGTAAAAMTFGDGRLCVGGSLVRLGVQITPSRNSAFPQPSDLQLSVLSPVTPGATRYYQAIYRDVGGPCGTGFNLTNGWRVTWGL